MLWLPGLWTPLGGACNAPSGPFAEISNILFEIISEMFRKSNYDSELVTPINIIFDCIKELFMLVITLYTACFFRAKINTNHWRPYF